MRLPWVLIAFVCGCDSLPAKDAAPVSKPSEEATHDKGEGPSPTNESLAEHGIELPSARGGVPVADAGPLIQISAEGTVVPTGARVGGKSWVATDASTPFSALAKALPAIGKEDGTAVLLVANRGDIRGFEVRPSPAEDPPPEAGALHLSVAVLKNGYRVSAAGQQPRQPVYESQRPSIPLAKPAAPLGQLERWDTQALETKVGQYKALFPDETSVRVCAEAAVPMGAVVAAAEALRGPECTRGATGACRFWGLRVCPEPWDTSRPTEKTPPPTQEADVRLRKIKANGAMDPDVARRIVRVHRDELRECYDTALEVDPKIKGELTLKLELGATGTVTAASVPTMSLDNDALETCVEKAGKGWKFPRPTDGGDVALEIPIAFGPKDGP